MLQFLKFVLATLVGLFLFFIVSFFILVGIGSALSSDDKVIVESNSVLKLDLDRPIKEVGVENPFSNLSIPFATNEETIGLKDIREAAGRDSQRLAGIQKVEKVHLYLRRSLFRKRLLPGFPG